MHLPNLKRLFLAVLLGLGFFVIAAVCSLVFLWTLKTVFALTVGYSVASLTASGILLVVLTYRPAASERRRNTP